MRLIKEKSLTGSLYTFSIHADNYPDVFKTHKEVCISLLSVDEEDPILAQVESLGGQSESK